MLLALLGSFTLATAENVEPWLGRWSSPALMRRDGGSPAQLLEEGELLNEAPDLSVRFSHEELVTCNMEEADAFWQTHPFRRSRDKMQKQLAAMRALRETKRLFAKESLPLIIVGDLLLGWRRGCLAPEIRTANPVVTVATFGPWLLEMGIDALVQAFAGQDLELETKNCRGPMMAGCRLSSQFTDETTGITTHLDVAVFVSAPPAQVGGPPGIFPRCARRCGATCEKCHFAWPQPSKVNPGRFYACPLPVADFKLVSWMNETFWVPSNLDAYLAVDYGDEWSEPGQTESTLHKPSCLPSQSSGLSLAPYDTLVSTIPHRSQIMRLQKTLARRFASHITKAASAEQHFWEEFFHMRSITWLPGAALPSAPEPLVESHVVAAPVPASSFLVIFGVLLTLVLLKLLMGAACGRCRWLARVAGVWGSMTAALGSVEVILLASYIFVFCARIMLQKHASVQLNHAGSNAAAASLCHAVVALGLFASTRFCVAPERNHDVLHMRRTLMKSPCKGSAFEKWPLWWWMLLAGALHSLSLWLSFWSLSFLDPVTYTMLWNVQAFLCRRRGAAAALVAVAALPGGWAAAAALGQAAAAAAAEVSVATVQAPIGFLHACQYSQGVLVLCAVLWLSGDPLPSNYWRSFINSTSMPACVTCMCLLNLGKPYLQQKVPSSLMATAPGISLLVMLLLGETSTQSSWHHLQVLLGLTAAALHAVDMAPVTLQRRLGDIATWLEARGRQEVTETKSSSSRGRPPVPTPPVLSKRPPVPPPPPRPLPRKLSSSTSEVGSTTASNSHSEHGESDCESQRPSGAI